MILLFLLICIVFHLFSIAYYKKIFNAVGFFLFMFIASALCTLCNNEIPQSVMDYGFIWISIGVIVFLLSFFIGQSTEGNTTRRKVTVCYNLVTVNLLINICLVSNVICLLLALYEVLPIAGSIQNILLNSTWVRNEYLNRHSNFIIAIVGNWANMTSLVLVCLFPIATNNKLKYIRVRLVAVILVKACVSIVTLSKDALVLYTVLLVVAYIDYFPNIKKEIEFLRKNVKWMLFILIVLFTIVAMQRSYIGTRYDNYFEAVMGTFTGYLSVPVESFSQLISSNLSQYTQGQLSFRPIANLLSIFGLGDKVDIKQDVINGTDSNVYTMFGTMYRDFGCFGIIFISIMYGLICGLIYRRQHNKKLSQLFVNSMVTMVFAFAYYDFKFIQTIYVASIIYAVILEKILINKLYIKIRQ